MDINNEQYQNILKILRHELVCAMGCTEPIAIAYCAAVARAALGTAPEAVVVKASGNIIKNAKSVTVPNTGGRRGIEAAAAIGIVAGDETKELQVIAGVDADGIAKLDKFLSSIPVKVEFAETPFLLDIEVEVRANGHSACARITNEHTHVAYVKKDGATVFGSEPSVDEANEGEQLDYSSLSIHSIYDFATTCRIEDVRDLLDKQIEMNCAIAKEGIKGTYGACVGRTCYDTYGDNVRCRAKAYAAAGSDARMNGCELPVVINSGSGNQGITVTLPVVEYAKELGVSREKLYRALLISNLIAIHEKSGIGRLSAYCGAVSAGAGAGAAVTYLMGGSENCIGETVINALAVTSGIVCDGAKSSCAAKIATAVEAGLLGGDMARNGRRFLDNEGLVKESAEDSIRNFARLGRDGMRETDKEIIRMMIE